MRIRHPLSQPPIKFISGTALSCVVLLAFAGIANAAAGSATANCGHGAQMRISSPISSQGSLLLVEVRSNKALENIKGEWTGKEILFWNAQTPTKSRSFIYRALLGVDLEQAEGKYELVVTSANPSNEEISCHAMLAIKAGHFATESLQVEKQFVEPDPEQLKRAQAEQEKLREILGRVTPNRLWQGNFRIPLDGVTTGKNFGKRRILNGQPGSPHGGVDLSAVMGTPVYSAQGGRVVLAEELYFPGNTVLVDHGLGIYTFYGHLSEISVKVGDEVKKGALLGKVGATGRVTGPHLHWGLMINRARVDPLQIVKLLPAESGS